MPSVPAARKGPPGSSGWRVGNVPLSGAAALWRWTCAAASEKGGILGKSHPSQQPGLSGPGGGMEDSFPGSISLQGSYRKER